MGQAVPVRTDTTAGEVRRIAKRAKDAAQARRLLAIAAVLDGSSRTTGRPLSFSSVAIFRNSPGTWGGRIFVNWLISREGQLSQRAVFGTPPVHRDLQSTDFHTFPDEIRGKEFISFDDKAATEKFEALWKKYALSASRP